MSNPPPLLQNLYLHGQLVNNELPHWIARQTSLVKIRLNWSRVGDDALQVLQALPNLLELWFYEGYNGEKLHFRKGGFSKLKFLLLECLIELNEVIIDEGALPVVEELLIEPCPKLKELPSGFHLLRNLKKLRFYDIQKEFAIRMQPVADGGNDYWKVELSHVLLVLFWYKRRGLRYNVYKCGDEDLIKRLKEDSN